MSDRSSVLVPVFGALAAALALAGVLVGVRTLLQVVPASAGTIPEPYVVTTTDDELDAAPLADPADLSLREAIWLAGRDGSSSVVVLARQATYRLTVCGPPGSQEDQDLDGDLDVLQQGSLRIEGNGATVQQTCPGERVLEHLPDFGVLDLRALVVTGGDAVLRGGGVHVPGGAGLQVRESTIRGNHAGQGGGGAYVWRGPALLEDSTISDNSVGDGRGGGIWSEEGPLDVVRSTVSHNVGQLEGGGIAGFDLSVQESTVVANTLVGEGLRVGANVHVTEIGLLRRSVFAFGVGASDCSPLAAPVFENLDSDGSCTHEPDGPRRNVHPQLGPLGEHGGATATHLPVVGSPVHDAAPLPCGDGRDQRGEARPTPGSSGCDLGSVEQPPAACTPPAFADVGAAHPFFDEVCWLDQMGIAGGFPDGTFRPSAPVSRQSMAAFTHRFALAPPVAVPTVPSFSDVGTSHPFFREVEWLAGSGIAAGFPDGTFRPGATVTRQAMAAFLFRISGDVGYVAPERSAFSDVGLGHPFFAPIHWAAERGLTDGYADGTWRPAAPVSRQAVAAFLQRLARLPGLDGI
jgi:hypothetical protein